MCIPKNFAEVLRTPILENADRLLLLKHLLKMTIAAPDADVYTRALVSGVSKNCFLLSTINFSL